MKDIGLDANLKDWTIMVYMAGDNNLSENMVVSLNDLISFASVQGATEKVNVLAFFDSNSLTAPTIYTDYSDFSRDKKPVVQELTRKQIYHQPKNTKLPENTPAELRLDGDSASAYSIMNFVRWCIRTQKRVAKNYALIFSGHSFGFHGTSFLRDEDTGSFITLYKLRWALEKICKDYLRKKLDVLGFDSCVMSMLEIGYEFKDVARIMIASEGSLPNSGWSYAPMLKKMIDEHNNEVNLLQSQKLLSADYFSSGQYVKDTATKLVEAFVQNHRKLAIGGRSIDISAWDLKKVTPLVRKVNEFGKELNKFLYLADKVQENKLTDDDIWAFQELKKIILQAHYDTQTYMYEQCIDLKDFCKRMLIELRFIQYDIETTNRSKVFDNLRRICRDIIELVDDCVVKSGFCGDEYQFSNGISLYFPWSRLAFDLTNFRYKQLLFNRGKSRQKSFQSEVLKGDGKHWYKFLHNYLTRVTLRLPRKRLDEKGNDYSSVFEDFDISDSVWNKNSELWSSKNPIWSRDNPRASRDNPRASRGDIGNYLFYFSRFKNYDLRWDIWGFADEFRFNIESD